MCALHATVYVILCVFCARACVCVRARKRVCVREKEISGLKDKHEVRPLVAATGTVLWCIFYRIQKTRLICELADNNIIYAR